MHVQTKPHILIVCGLSVVVSFIVIQSLVFEFRIIRSFAIMRYVSLLSKLTLTLHIQEAAGASYAATVKTIRQVKTVFIIFVSFFCCWSPYVVVLLYDRSDSLPLCVHLYASMLAHLHANLNVAIYSLGNPTVRAAYRRLVARVVAYCCRRTPASDAAAVASVACSSSSRRAGRTAASAAGGTTEVDVNRTLVTVECHQLDAGD